MGDRKPATKAQADVGGDGCDKENGDNVYQRTPEPTHKWRLNFTDATTHVSHTAAASRPTSARPVIEQYLHPPGFPLDESPRDPFALSIAASSTPPRTATGATVQDAAHARSALKAAYSRSWSVAFSPFRSIFTSTFALYLSGSRPNIFSVATVTTVLLMHIRTLFNTRAALAPFHHRNALPLASLAPQFFIHGALGALAVVLAVHKAHSLGFLPTTHSDWVAFIPPAVVTPMAFRHAPPLH